MNVLIIMRSSGTSQGLGDFITYLNEERAPRNIAGFAGEVEALKVILPSMTMAILRPFYPSPIMFGAGPMKLG